MRRLPSSGLLWWMPQPSTPCPVEGCGLTDGFHDHRHVVVDPQYHKEKGWHKKDE